MHGGETLRTYQDLTAVGENEKDRMEFVRGAVRDHTSSDDYKIAAAAEAYYAKHNPTIEKFQKFLYNANGQAYPDLFSANYKLKTLFFRRFVIQQVQYVLSNGVTFEQDRTKERLGGTFDSRISQLAKKAMVDKVAFGFWNYDHLEVFSFADTPNEPGFAPLYDEDDGFLKAGVRYWSLDGTETKRYTLYELDGYTEYIQRKGEDIQVSQGKRPYRQTIRRSEVDGETVEGGDNYPGFPIIPMYANDLRQSELVGIRESIDCYDFVKSGLANEIDDSSGKNRSNYHYNENCLKQFFHNAPHFLSVLLDAGNSACGGRYDTGNRKNNGSYGDFFAVAVRIPCNLDLGNHVFYTQYWKCDDRVSGFLVRWHGYDAMVSVERKVDAV